MGTAADEDVHRQPRRHFEYKGVLRDYVKISTLNETEELLDRYGIRYVLYAPATALAYHLGKSSNWREIYRDHDTVLFARVAGR